MTRVTGQQEVAHSRAGQFALAGTLHQVRSRAKNSSFCDTARD